MTDTIEQKALALVREVAGYEIDSVFHDAAFADVVEAVHRAIEQHEAFRQEVSDAGENILTAFAEGTDWTPEKRAAYEALAALIVAKSDPLVEALNDMKDGRAGPTTESYAACLRAAIEQRGGKIVWGEG